MTMHITTFDRDMDRESWRLIWRIMRKVGDAPRLADRADASEIAQRVDLQNLIDSCTVDGRIGKVVSGMDCDCVQYCHGREIDAPRAIKWQAEVNSEYEWADGPMSVSICRPDELPENYSRDLAMEAYENGHPHSIHC